MAKKTNLDLALARLDAATEQLETAKARDNLLDFVCYTYGSNYKVNWHHRVIADAATRFARGQCRRLIICTPPQRGKSEIISRRLTPFILGVRPDAKIIHCSYNERNTLGFSDDIIQILKSEEYQKVFPGIELAKSCAGTTVRGSDWVTLAGGNYRARGAISGGISGLPADYLILDDVIKGAEDARSETLRESTWKWYTRDVFSRLGKNTGICLINTRWHVDDITGRLLAAAKENPETADQWEIIEIREVREENDDTYGGQDPRNAGDFLWESERPAKQGRAIQVMDPQSWSAQYQQHPVPESGVIIHKDWLTDRWMRLPGQTSTESKPNPGIWVQSWDCRAGGKCSTSSYAVGSIWYRPYNDPRVFLVDLERGRWSVSETIEKIKELSLRYPEATVRLVEAKADGKAIIDIIGQSIKLTDVTPSGSKESRLRAVSTMIEAGQLVLPHKEAMRRNGETSEYVVSYEMELVTFPSSTNDDQVDVTSMALGWFQQRNHVANFWYQSGAKRQSFGFKELR